MDGGRIMILVRGLILVTVFALLAGIAGAVEPDEILDNPVLEARARVISAEIRCVVCQNESVDTSNAGIAKDIRILIREKLVSGSTDQEVIDFLVARYGDFVLLRPPFKPETYVLWIAPFAIIGFGGVWIGFMLVGLRRKGRAQKPAPLSAAEERAVAQMVAAEKPTNLSTEVDA